MRLHRRVSLFVTMGTLAAIGCATPNAHGESVRAALRAQAAPAKKTSNAVEGLDSQEAATIASHYRRSLAPKEEPKQEGNVILVAPSASRGGARAPAPSVPKD